MDFNRNKLAVRLLFISLIFALVFDVVNKTPIAQTLLLAVIGILSVGISAFMTYKRKAEEHVRYIILIGMYILAFFLIKSSQSMSDYLLLYYSLAFVSLYHDFNLIIIAGILNVILTNYFFFAYGETMFKSYGVDDLVGFNLYLILTTFILAFQSRIGTNMRKSLEENNEKSKEDNIKLEEMLDQIGNTVEVLNNISNGLAGNVKSMKEMSEKTTMAFNEIAERIEIQSHSESEINKSMYKSNGEILSIADSSTNMREISSVTVEISNGGNKEIDLLNEEFTRVGININETVSLVKDLQEQTNQIGVILTAINETANQTNLLALNAAIEAARAGEEGKGFAVVASEISKLAQNSTKSTGDISLILNEIHIKVESATDKVAEVQNSFESSKIVIEKVEYAFEKVNRNMDNVFIGAKDMEEKIKNLQESSNNIVVETASIASTTEEINGAVDGVIVSVVRQNEEIEQIVNSFKEIEDLVQQLGELSN